MPNELLPISIKGLKLTKGERQLLRDLNLHIDEPGISIILGPNGAGKSLLLRSIHGLLTPDHGAIHLGGYTVEKSREKQAMVFQRPVLMRRTVLQNLAFAAPETAQKEPKRLLEALASVHLADRTEQPARMLSGGEQQRLALARALLMEPDLLLLDEPTANLDPSSVLLIESLVKGQSEKGTKVIMVSHDLGQARRLANEVIFLAKGQVVEQNVADQFFATPESSQARAFLAGEILI